MEFFILFSILWFWCFHYIFDFICQTKWQAEHKHDNIEALSNHVIVYSWGMDFSTCLFLYGCGVPLSISIFFGGLSWFYFALTHLVTDFITSKISHHYFSKKDYHMGFVVVGLDQIIHFLTIMIPLFILI
jgi:hypothetical protein